MNAYLHMLQYAVRDRVNCRLLIRLTLLQLVCGAAALIFFYHRAMPQLGSLIFFSLNAFTGYLWASEVLRSAILQHRPVHACLVPGLRGRLMGMVGGLFVLCAVALALTTRLILGHGGGYALLAGMLLSVYILFTQRYYWLVFFPSVLIVVSVSSQNRPLRALMALGDDMGEPLITALGLIVAIVLFALGLQLVFPRGGDQHWRWAQCREARVARFAGRRPADAPPAPRWVSWFRIPYAAALRRDLRDGASRGRLMMHTLGTAADDSGALLYAVAATAVMVLVGRYVATLGDARLALMTCSLMQGCLLLSSLMYATAVAASITRHAAEQRLYMLTPAAPPAAQFNRVLFGTLMQRFLRMWGVLLVAVMLIDLLCLGRMRGLGFALAMLMLPAGGLLLRRYATMPVQRSEGPAILMTLAVVAGTIGATVMSWADPAPPWVGIGAAFGVAAAVGLYLRWRQLVAMPPVLPAGRLLA
ncbi:hypothetical protein [Duganella callida]|uniref:Uncharacterized protein n=1 Tax=Duganella callida TaxID=2561932 RepID=A0A4Y9SY37_9BURK|nr:hypothetical protein [Duganella callida]TFW29646.1 hypothetical protein E4L98_03620 [Duganella callida]